MFIKIKNKFIKLSSINSFEFFKGKDQFGTKEYNLLIYYENGDIEEFFFKNDEEIEEYNSILQELRTL